MAQDYTTIRVTQSAKDAAEASKRDGETWNDYLQRCTDEPPSIRTYVDAESVEGLSYDDVVQAGRKAIREEFPDEVLKG